MITETTRFNNNLLAFLITNQRYLDDMAKRSSDKQMQEHIKKSKKLIEWYEKGNVIQMETQVFKPAELEAVPKKQNKRKYEIPPVLKEKLREHEVELVEYMLKVGFYNPNDLWLTGVQRSIETYCQTIIESKLDDKMGKVKECIDRVKAEMDKGKVKNKQAYLQRSLQKMAGK